MVVHGVHDEGKALMCPIKGSLPDNLNALGSTGIGKVRHDTQKKRKLWVGMAVSHLTWGILTIKVGSWGQKTLKRLRARLKHLRPPAIAADKWEAYRAIIPASLVIRRTSGPVSCPNLLPRY